MITFIFNRLYTSTHICMINHRLLSVVRKVHCVSSQISNILIPILPTSLIPDSDILITNRVLKNNRNL